MYNKELESDPIAHAEHTKRQKENAAKRLEEVAKKKKARKAK